MLNLSSLFLLVICLYACMFCIYFSNKRKNSLNHPPVSKQIVEYKLLLTTYSLKDPAFHNTEMLTFKSYEHAEKSYAQLSKMKSRKFGCEVIRLYGS